MRKKSYQYSSYKSKQNNDDHCISSKFSWTNMANKTWIFVRMPFHKEFFFVSFLQIIIFRFPTNMKKLVIVNTLGRLLRLLFSLSLRQFGNLWSTLKIISIFRGVRNCFDEELNKNEKFQKFIRLGGFLFWWWVEKERKVSEIYKVGWVLCFVRVYCIWPLLCILVTNMLNSWTWHIAY